MFHSSKQTYSSVNQALEAEMDNSVRRAMPKDIPFKLVVAKMKQMIKKGIVDGCGCGCRGDYVITQKGLEQLNKISLK